VESIPRDLIGRGRGQGLKDFKEIVSSKGGVKYKSGEKKGRLKYE
jgi:hypothetical protein